MWAIIGLSMVGLLAIASSVLSQKVGQINDNFDRGDHALRVADEALSLFYANFKPEDNLNLREVRVDASGAGDIDTTIFFENYTGADLKVTDFSFDSAWVRLTPMKLFESQLGDVYLLEAESTIPAIRSRQPTAARFLRTYAHLVPPISILAAFNAPNGFSEIAATKTASRGNRLELDGRKKDKCGSGTSIAALAAPAGSVDLQTETTWDRTKTDSSGSGVDSSTTSYKELRDSLHVDWSHLSSDATYAFAPHSIVIPRDYATLDAIPWKTFSRKGIWPSILVHGNTLITADVKGFGMLVIDGSLTIDAGVFGWDGLVMTGRQLIVEDAPGQSHLHVTGAVATGLNCTAASILAKACRDMLNGEHTRVTYAQCNVEAAWAGLLALRPLTQSRHVRLF